MKTQAECFEALLKGEKLRSYGKLWVEVEREVIVEEILGFGIV